MCCAGTCSYHHDELFDLGPVASNCDTPLPARDATPARTGVICSLVGREYHQHNLRTCAATASDWAGVTTPVACCGQFEELERNSTQLLDAMEAYSTDVFWYFVMSSIGSQLYRCGWEYWEQHHLIGWAVIRRVFYSPTELYGTREDVAHMCSAFTTSVAFGLLNPYINLLAAVYAIGSKRLFDLRLHYFRPLARGTSHPGPRMVPSVLLYTPLIYATVVWLTFAREYPICICRQCLIRYGVLCDWFVILPNEEHVSTVD